MKKATLSLKKTLSISLLLCGMNLCAWSMEGSSYNYDIGENWETGSLDSRGFSDVASSSGGRSGFKETSLDELPEIRKYMFKGSLEITPENYEGLLQFSDLYGMAFGNYNRGIFVKRWKTSLGTDVLLDLLLKFTHINKFKIEIVWDYSNVDMSETIARSVQFFGDLGELTISKCQLTDQSLEDILESLKSPETLKILDIRENRLSDSVLPKIRERLIRLIDLKTELVSTESKSLSVKESDSDRISEELKAERLKREAAEQRASNAEKQRLEEAKRYADERKQQEEQERAKKPEKAQSVPAALVERPIQKSHSIPAIARGYEEIYARFLRGVLIYKPTAGSNVGKIELPIASLLNPLEGTFDLSKCGSVMLNAGKGLSISTGYRKGKVAANANKYEIWIAPKFLVESELGRTAGHYRDIMSKWTAPFGIFYTHGSWDDKYYDYLVTSTPEEISTKNLDEICRCTTRHSDARYYATDMGPHTPASADDCYFTLKFY